MSPYNKYRKRSEIPDDEIAAMQKQVRDEFDEFVAELSKERKRLPAYRLMRALKKVDGRVEWVEPDMVRKLLSFAIHMNDRPTIRFMEAILEDRPELAEQIGMKAFMRESFDGPVDPSGFRWKGHAFSGLTATQFRLLKFHWSEGSWRVRYFNEDDYADEVFLDHAICVDRGRVDGHQKAINRAFREASMLLHMTVESERSYVKEINEEDFKKTRGRQKKKR